MRDLFAEVQESVYHRREESGGASASQLASKAEYEKSVRTNRQGANGHPLPGTRMRTVRCDQ